MPSQDSAYNTYLANNAQIASSTRTPGTLAQGLTLTQPAGGVTLGISTGKLIDRGHVHSPLPGQKITVSVEQMYLGIAIIGATGSGKTRAALIPIVDQWLSAPQQRGLFAFGVKANWALQLCKLARYAGVSRERVHLVGPGREKWDIMRGMEPGLVGKFVADMIAGDKGAGDQFWVKSGGAAVERAAKILVAVTSGRRKFAFDGREHYYDIAGIATILRATADRKKFAELTKDVLAACEQLPSIERDEVTYALEGLLTYLVEPDQKTPDSIRSTIDTILSQFVENRELRETFGGSDSTTGLDAPGGLTNALNRGQVVALDIPLEMQGGEALYALAFRRFSQTMMARVGKKPAPILFVADEYAKIATHEHGGFFSLCRESRIAPIIAYQSQSNLITKLNNNVEMSTGLAHGMRTKILFGGTTDSASITIFNEALGKAELTRMSYSESSGSGGSGQHNTIVAAGWSNNSGRSYSQNVTERPVVDHQYMQSLRSSISRDYNAQGAEVIVMTENNTRQIADVMIVQPTKRKL